MEFITVDLVKKLICNQFPHWANLEIKPVKDMGHDNRTFHLGDSLCVRLPSGKDYALQSMKEQKWLPLFKKELSIKIPEIIGQGKECDDYPYTWSICSWIKGDTPKRDNISDMNKFAKDLGEFLISLHAIDTTDGPPAGSHNFYRGGDIKVYDDEYRMLVKNVSDTIELDQRIALEIWDLALSSKCSKSPVWVHGDMAPTNILILHGQLEAVIDFGILGVGDPACDLAMYWTFFEGDSKKIFKDTINLDKETWDRARGWVIWKCLIDIHNYSEDSCKVNTLKKIIHELVYEYKLAK